MLEPTLNKLDNASNEIEKNLYITNLRYIFHIEFKEQIEIILNSYKNKTIGEKRASEISKKIANLINKKANRICIYGVPEDKWRNTYYDTTGKKYEFYGDIPKNNISITTQKRTDYYNNDTIHVSISYNSLSITTIYFKIQDNKYIYEESNYNKRRYTPIEDIPALANKIKELYNNSVLKIQELKEEIKKQENNINNECIRGLTNNCLYIYGDYRDKLLD